MRTSLFLISTILIAACNLTGANHRAAEQNGKAWAEHASTAIETKFISCNGIDSDGDGYLSCTFAVNGAIQTFECAGYAAVGPHDGCRTPKVHIPTPVTNVSVSTKK